MNYRHSLFALLAAPLALSGLAASAQDKPAATPPGAERQRVPETAVKGEAQDHKDHTDHSDHTAPKAAALMPGYGNGGFAITTAVPQAQAFFTNGMQLAPAFAHRAAVGAMAEAVRLDPACGMCLWGLALADGPTINYGKDAAERKPLRQQAKQAVKLIRKAGTLRELALAEALALRYRGGKNVAKHDRAFADAMRALAAQYPADDVIAVLAADAIMVAARSDEEVAPAIPYLETVLARSPDDTPAIHFYIHASEIVGTPAKAEPYADKLARLAPKAAHLVHMPSHTFYWVGRYQDAADTNLRAVELGVANARALGLPDPEGVWDLPYHAHNVIFGLGGSLMAGDAVTGLALARPLVARSAVHDNAHPVMQLLAASGYFALARFEAPDAVLALPEPKSAYLKAARHYARGEVLAGRGNVAGVETELAAIPVTLIEPEKGKGKKAKVSADPYASPKAPEQMLGITRAVLRGRIAMLQGRHADAAKAFAEGAEIEETKDFSVFADPPAFWYPVRRDMGRALLAAGDTAGARRELEASLKLRPKDPVALELLAKVSKALAVN